MSCYDFAMPAEVTVVQSPVRYSLKELNRLAVEPLRRSGAERAVVFGSYARGSADGYSDLDLAVVLDTHLPPSARWPLLREVLDALPVSVDLLVYTPEEFARGVEQGFGVFDAIVREGVPFYARPEN